MDNHPIPQDVTNFQFRLIGDMTLKQFGYILGGVVFAWVMLASPLFFLIKVVLGGGCVLSGVILAFVPLEGRPADIMVSHFIKALFNPTRFIYQKSAATQQAPIKQLITTMSPQMPKNIVNTPSEKEEARVQVESFSPIATAAVKQQVEEEPVVLEAQPTTPNTQPVHEEEELKKELQDISQQLAAAQAQEAQAQIGTVAEVAAQGKVTDLESQLQEVLKQKQELENQLVSLQKSLNEKKGQVFSPATAQQPTVTQNVKKIPKPMSAGVGTPLVPDVPNLITGVVKDPRNNLLSHILIEIKDKDNNPVRAFKTNQLGQFAAATPLLNGTYTISFEDPEAKQSFDSVEVTANGEIMLPLEIISVDAREKLRQELFGASV